ncbi:MAG: replication initiator protein A, partial [Butyricicoccus sp.]|nr:replication initiator protein A [Butyricicoccus sp.]
MKPFPLMKREEIVSFYHLQMPRWLFADPNYKQLSLHAKVAYTFLLNRYQLSQRNGWVNEDDEVYVIFTRAELADEMQVSYKKAIACFAELQDAKLIWEVRRGRGLPNHIYLAQVEHALPPRSPGASILEPCAEPAGLEESENFEQSAEAMPEAPIREQKEQVLMRQSDTSRPVVWDVSDLPVLQPSNTYKKQKEKKNIEIQSVCPPGRTEWADRLVLEQILEGCELEALKPDERLLFTDAIGWLFYAGEVRIGPCCYPQGYVRSRLHLLDYETLCDAAQKLAENRTRIRGNALSYAAKVVFWCLIEREAGLSLDPALNEMKRQY